MIRQSKIGESKVFSAGLALILAFALVGMCRVQTENRSKHESSTVPDEIVVYGKKHVLNLRIEIYSAQEHFLELHSSLNSNDDFDFGCDTRELFGIGYRGQLSKARFQRTYERLLANRGGVRWFKHRTQEKEALMDQEIIVLPNQHPELQRVFTSLSEAETAYYAERSNRSNK